MGSILSVAIAIGIIVVVAVLVAILSYVRGRKLVSGYEEIEPDVLMLKQKIHGEVFRDGTDLVISGSESGVPVVVRFSYAENTPGINIRVHAPATLNLVVLPKNSQFVFPNNLRINVNTPDDMFNARYLTRTDDSAAARMLLLSRQVMKEFQKLLCSSRTTLNLTHGLIELSETTIPEPYTGSHASGHIESMLRLAKVLADMPGAHLVPVPKPTRDHKVVLKLAIAIGVIAALVTLAGATKEVYYPSKKDFTPVAMNFSGIPTEDAAEIGGITSYHLADAKEQDGDFDSWLRGQNVDPQSKLALDLSGKQNPDYFAYLLVNEESNRRLVLMHNRRVIFDGRYLTHAAIARLPKANFSKVEWKSTVGAEPEGDGILFVADPKDANTAYIFYTSSGILVCRELSNWQDLSVEN